MVCREVKRVVYFFLDGSLGDQKRQDVDNHLKRCPQCEMLVEFQRRLRRFVQSRLARMSTTAPDRLRTRLVRSIRAFHTEWSQP